MGLRRIHGSQTHDIERENKAQNVTDSFRPNVCYASILYNTLGDIASLQSSLADEYCVLSSKSCSECRNNLRFSVCVVAKLNCTTTKDIVSK